MYADYSFYSQTYFGEILTEDNAARWLSRASDELDTLTFGRLISAFPTEAAHEEKVRKAACAVADVLFLVDVQRRAVSAQKGQDGQYRGAVASVTSGKESISYAVTGTAASTYSAAAASPDALANLVWDTACKYLANIPDATGINLLYAGV
ncbi:MAG: hypothetical protein IJT94_06705 [Oscillibacter sp.]|nr:hypothetical protein [Oscillibacter sp.]